MTRPDPPDLEQAKLEYGRAAIRLEELRVEALDLQRQFRAAKNAVAAQRQLVSRLAERIQVVSTRPS